MVLDGYIYWMLRLGKKTPIIYEIIREQWGYASSRSYDTMILIFNATNVRNYYFLDTRNFLKPLI